MIRTLRLVNWKSYVETEIKLDSGTTFLIASNGVGKTSIVQALHFAIFGGPHLAGPLASPVSNAIRSTATEATVECSMDVAGSDVTIHRTVRRGRKDPELVSVIRADGRVLTDREWLQMLEAGFGLDSPQLASIAVLPEGSLLSSLDAGTDIASALESVFGVGRLRAAAEEVENQALRMERETDASRRQLRDTPLRQEETRLTTLTEAADQVGERLGATRARLNAEQDVRAQAEAWQVYKQRQIEAAEIEGRRRRQREALYDRAESVIMDDLARGLSVVDGLSNARDANTRRRATIEMQIELANAALGDLDSGSAVCPTCLRPLSADELATARAAHESSVERANAELEQIHSRAEVVDSLWAEVLSFERLPSPPVLLRPDFDEPEIGSLHDGLTDEVALLQGEYTRVNAEIDVLNRDRARRDQDERLSRRLRSEYRRIERARVLAATMSGLADAISADRIAPLASEVERWWPELWPGESITMASTGALGLGETEHRIPFSEFSGGQRTIAQILVRLLALQMATTCPFLILDEPLEHLDPHRRRALVSLLVKAGADQRSSMRQVIVTTYEETVTRRASRLRGLDREGNDGPHLRYVRSEAAAEGASGAA